VEIPNDWTYLALAHARSGNLAEDRKMLKRLRDWRPDSSTTFWDLQEVTLLRVRSKSCWERKGGAKEVETDLDEARRTLRW